MIIDTIANAQRYTALHPLFPRVLEYIRQTDLLTLPNGRHKIFGDDVLAIVERASGRRREDAQLECHRKYIDIQLVLNGVDEMGWKPLANCHQQACLYDSAHDIQFFNDVPDVWLTTVANAFCIFFPEDAHAPLVSTQPIHKIVFKVAVNASQQ
jgi:YhcH/YjgK/YiaL family protein